MLVYHCNRESILFYVFFFYSIIQVIDFIILIRISFVFITTNNGSQRGASDNIHNYSALL